MAGSSISVNSLRAVGALSLAILMWVFTSLLSIIQEEREVTDELAVRVSVLEAQFNDHVKLVHREQ